MKKREFKEETGLTVDVGKLVYAGHDLFIKVNSKKPIHGILLYYLVKNPRGKVSTKYLDDFEKNYVKKSEWVSVKRINKVKFYNPVNNPRLIKLALKEDKQ